MPIPKGVRNKHRFSPSTDVAQATVVPCGACGEKFSAKTGLEAMTLLIEHLRGNVRDPKHREELAWVRKEVLSRYPERTDA